MAIRKTKNIEDLSAMRKVLEIKGTAISIVPSPKTNVISDLSAEYKGKKYVISKVTGASSAYILHFFPQDEKFVPHELNIILLMTTGNGKYRALGMSEYDTGDGKPEWYSLGDDLEVKLEDSVDKAIRGISNDY